MIKQFYTTFALSILFFTSAFAKKGTMQGKVVDKYLQTPIANCKIQIGNDILSAYTDSSGAYYFDSIPVGSFNVTASLNGYVNQTQFNIIITSGNTQEINFELEKSKTSIDGIKVVGTKKQTATVADIVTPLSIQKLTATEIRSNPGGNFDISKVIQALPGVAGNTGAAAFRNDIIIRGGAPNENVFYLDGIEIPVINHFQTQGSSGGPAGILNISFIEDVRLTKSAFDARYDNALSSVFQFKQREGNSKKQSGNIRLSGTETAVTLEGPLSKNTTYLASFRRSYLQLLFELIDIPIRPNFWDFQTKITTKLNSKTTLSFIGVGAIDEFTTVSSKNNTPENLFIENSVPYINQWNYTNGLSLKRTVRNGFYNIALSRNMFNNAIDQFQDKAIGDESKRNLKIRSQEIENKLRFEYNKVWKDWKWSTGAVAQYVKFNNDLFSRFSVFARDAAGNLILDSTNSPTPISITGKYNTAIDFFRYGLFGQANRKFLDDKLGVNIGFRTDMNSFTTNGNNPLNTFSPRVSASYAFAPKWSVNATVGKYYKLPIYTALGYQNASGVFVNKDLDYTATVHYGAGVEYLPKSDLRITAEVFHKDYSNTMVSKRNGIALANLGADFDVLGNEEILSNGTGQATGFELFFQKKLTKTFFATISYTYAVSRFSGADGKLVASSWDNRHLFSGIVGKKFKRNWEIGLKLRVTGGSPYSPYDTLLSRSQFVLNNRGVFNNSQINTLRLGSFSQFDFRIDKKINFRKKTLDLFLDVQNALVAKNPSVPNFTLKRNLNNTDWITTDGNPLNTLGSNGIPIVSSNNTAIPTPTIGFIFEF
jgi:hypothetical protein